MASAQRLLSRQLWQVGRCSLCRQLHPQLPSQSFQTSPLPHLEIRTGGVPFQQGNPATTATLIRASSGRGGRNGDEGQAVTPDRYRDRYRDEGFAPDNERSAKGAEGGGVKSFRGWGKFSKPSTWGTKTKRVWKSKQLAPYLDDDSDGGNELYPVRDSVQNARRPNSDVEIEPTSPHFRNGSDPGAGTSMENDGEVRHKVFGVSDVSDAGSLSESNTERDSPSSFGRQRTEGGSRRFGVVDSKPDLTGGVSETKVRTVGGPFSGSEKPPRVSDSPPKKKDIIKKAYKRPGSIHSEEDRQPWVRGEKVEKVQQVYSGLKSQVKETEEGEEDDGEPSAARDLVWGQEIDFKVYQFTPLGMRVIIRGGYDGLVYNDQLELYGRERVEIGDIMKGYVFKIRDDNKVDVSLRAFGTTQYEVDKIYLEEQLIIYGGFIPLTSKSPPEEIAAKLKLTKNGFKKAVGGLMKIGRAMETEEGIVLIEAEDGRAASRTRSSS